MTVVPFSPEPRRRAAPFASQLTNVNNASYETGHDDNANIVVHARDLEGVVMEVENAGQSGAPGLNVRIYGNLPDVAESALPTIGSGSWVPVQAEDDIANNSAKAYADSRRFSWYAIQLKKSGTADAEAQVTVRGY